MQKAVRKLFFLFCVLTGLLNAQEKKACEFVFPQTLSVNSCNEDYIKMTTNCHLKTFKMKVYNRWGLEIYTTDSPPDSGHISWKWQKEKSGTYYYLVEYTYVEEKEPEAKKLTGYLTIVSAE